MSRPAVNPLPQETESPEKPGEEGRQVHSGPPRSFMRLPVGSRQEILIHRRAVAITIVLVLAALTVMVLSILTGTYNISAADALGALLRGAGSELDRFIIIDQRLPRALAAVLVGAMLALSGAIFQSLSRNPLGSPDIVGFTTGASTGGLLAILLVSASSTFQIGAGTILGGFATATFVALITLRRGIGGDNLILAGIALSEMLSAANNYLISRAPLQSAEVAKAWQYGSFNAISWGQVRPLLIAAIMLLPQVLSFGPRPCWRWVTTPLPAWGCASAGSAGRCSAMVLCWRRCAWRCLDRSAFWHWRPRSWRGV